MLARVGIVRLLGDFSLLGILSEGVAPPRELAERAGFLYRPAAIQTSIDEIEALPTTIRLVNQSAFPGAWRDWPVVVVWAHGGNPRFAEVIEQQGQLAEFSTRGKQIVVEGSHFVQ